MIVERSHTHMICVGICVETERFLYKSRSSVIDGKKETLSAMLCVYVIYVPLGKRWRIKRIKNNKIKPIYRKYI